MNKLAIIFLFSIASGVFARPQSDYEYPTNEDYATNDDIENEETVIPAGKAPVFLEESKDLIIKEGQNVTMSCRTKEKAAYVLLFSKGNSDPSKREKLLFADDASIVRGSKFTPNNNAYILVNADRNDTGKYYCTFQADKHGDIQIVYNLVVEYSPSVQPFEPNIATVLKGDSVNFDCKSDGNPKPAIVWSRETMALPENAKTDGSRITIMEVDRHSEGTYICTADNGVGDPAFASKKLMVEYEPEIITEKQIIRTGNGDSVELVCLVHARPKAEVVWSQEGNENFAHQHESEDIDGSQRHSVMISDVTEADFGTYKCSASNGLGIATAMINLTDLPSKPLFTSDPTGAEENQYTLTFEIESFYPLTEYLLKYRTSMANASEPWKEESIVVEEGSLKSDDVTHTIMHTIEELMPATDYDVIVSGKNQHKWGDTATFKFSTRKARPTTTTQPPEENVKENASHITAGANYVTFSMALVICSLTAHLIS